MNKKTIWITGGSTGIGKALAIKFANKGWNVAISARRENLLKEISDNNENIHGFPLDVTDKSKCKEVFDASHIDYRSDIQHPSAAEMIPLAWRAFQDKKFEDVASFEPFYLTVFYTTAKKLEG